MIFPKNLMIEIVSGLCPSRCIMCNIEKSLTKGVMSNEKFTAILEKFYPYKEKLLYTTLQGLGEPLLDKNIVKKVQIAKKMGFPSIGFSTSAVNLDYNLALNLIQSKLDTIIFSVDGLCAETHESIRIGTDFNKIKNNIDNFIMLRNDLGKTKIIVRMILQEKNAHEWPDYQTYWLNALNKKFGDQVSAFNVHNFDSEKNKEIAENLKDLSKKKSVICSEIYERFVVRVNGNVSLCCVDDFNWYDLGNVLNEDPISIYNRGWFLHYRKKMNESKIYELPYCSSCSALKCFQDKVYLNIAK
ncbi:SPASM domain-containing protein [Allochromatium humboldtianum]|uniref:SPASM domain-containing protein n=1 Tax=Allochromatium humboldtianum TaxID=504901 RepID=A0A850RMW2_9GAMM|nr:radical SAM/SPASM domain-containing protein [Allochromatium humboldtianum]NVZ10283.1 SPASM domain-containing protein [Allochromatium humboldtianum]